MQGLPVDARAWALAALVATMSSSIAGAAPAKIKGDAAATCGGLAEPMENAVRIDSAAIQAPVPLAVAERGLTPAARVTPATPE